MVHREEVLAGSLAPELPTRDLLPIRDRLPMRRRDFIVVLGGAMASPLGASARRTSKTPLRVGWASPERPGLLFLERTFKERMLELGYVENETIVFEITQIPNYSKDAVEQAYRGVVRREVELVLAWGASSAVPAAASAVAGKLPIVIASPDFDPVVHGYAASYRRPGGNLTGAYSVQVELTEKRLQLMTEAFLSLKAFSATMSRPAGSCPTGRTFGRSGNALRTMSTSLPRGPIRQSCRSSSPRNSTWWPT